MSPSAQQTNPVKQDLASSFLRSVNDTDVVVIDKQHNRSMVVVEELPEVSEPQYSVAVKWLVDPAGSVVDVSPAERTDRARATILAAHAASREVLPGVGLVALNNELRDALARKGARRTAAFPPTVVSAYLRCGHTGYSFAVVEGHLTRSDLDLDAPVDALAWLDRTQWHFDVFSACKRVGGFASECRGGRVRRCVRLATDLLGCEGGRASVRVFNPMHGLVPVVNLAAFTISAGAGDPRSKEVVR